MKKVTEMWKLLNRIIDKMDTMGGIDVPEIEQFMSSVLDNRNFQCFDISNVIGYMAGVDSKKKWGLHDCSTLITPYATTWFEGVVPVLPDSFMTAIGAWVQRRCSTNLRAALRQIYKQGVEYRATNKDDVERSLCDMDGILDQPGWVLKQFNIFRTKRHGIPPPRSILYTFIDDDGQYLDDFCFVAVKEKGEVDAHRNMCLAMANIVGFTTSLLACKNVVVEDCEFPPKQMQKKRRRKGKSPLTIFKRLRIGPIQEVTKKMKGMTDLERVKQALHLCRGHFKTYTDAMPLLGRHVGTYWWESHARGSKNREEKLLCSRPRSRQVCGHISLYLPDSVCSCHCPDRQPV